VVVGAAGRRVTAGGLPAAGPSPADLAARGVPEHVGVIMDGNGRWAGQRGLPRTDGHAEGETALFDAVEGALEVGLSWMTVYAFSTENWRRPPAEVAFIMWFNRDLLQRRARELDERGVRVRFVGRKRRPIPRSLLRIMTDTEELTAGNERMTLQIAFNYGGRAELVDAARRLAEDAAAGTLRPQDVDEAAITARTYWADAPDVDLMVRTSGERRLSNFLLWQAAYAELVFDDVLWPDFRREHLFAAIAEFQRRTRRFGAV
jgi:undecaprenyl diphosphate synthase